MSIAVVVIAAAEGGVVVAVAEAANSEAAPVRFISLLSLVNVTLHSAGFERPTRNQIINVMDAIHAYTLQKTESRPGSIV